jgi:hypothetical protein
VILGTRNISPGFLAAQTTRRQFFSTLGALTAVSSSGLGGNMTGSGTCEHLAVERYPGEKRLPNVQVCFAGRSSPFIVSWIEEVHALLRQSSFLPKTITIFELPWGSDAKTVKDAIALPSELFDNPPPSYGGALTAHELGHLLYSKYLKLAKGPLHDVYRCLAADLELRRERLEIEARKAMLEDGGASSRRLQEQLTQLGRAEKELQRTVSYDNLFVATAAGHELAANTLAGLRTGSLSPFDYVDPLQSFVRPSSPVPPNYWDGLVHHLLRSTGWFIGDVLQADPDLLQPKNAPFVFSVVAAGSVLCLEALGKDRSARYEPDEINRRVTASIAELFHEFGGYRSWTPNAQRLVDAAR